jgi:hypothetical protein
MDDRQLLEAAARAYGLEGWTWDEDWSCMRSPAHGSPDGPAHAYWGPLEDDGEAFRLAVKLGLAIIYETEYLQGDVIPTVEVIGGERPNGSRHCEMHSLDDDPAATVRRCIVRAAASLQETKQ